MIAVEIKVKPLKLNGYKILLYKAGKLIKEEKFDNEEDIPKYTKRLLEEL